MRFKWNHWINNNDDNDEEYSKNGCFRDINNGNISNIKFIYGKKSKNIRGKFKAN